MMVGLAYILPGFGYLLCHLLGFFNCTSRSCILAIQPHTDMLRGVSTHPKNGNLFGGLP